MSEEQAAVLVIPQEQGGVTALVKVPTYSGDQTFSITVERDADGDWRVFIPWSRDFGDEPLMLDNGTEVSNGIVYLGAPDDPSVPEGYADMGDGLLNRREYD